MNGKSSLRQTICEDWPLLLVLAVSFVAGLAVAARIQVPVPLHWNWAGEADRTTSALAAALELPAMTAGIYLLLVFGPRLDPRCSNYERFRPTRRLFRWAFVLLMAAMTWVPLAAGLGYALDTGKSVRLIISTLFLVLGNSLGQIKSTFLVGIRTPGAHCGPELHPLRTTVVPGNGKYHPGLAAPAHTGLKRRDAEASPPHPLGVTVVAFFPDRLV